MTIASLDELVDALGNGSSRVVIDKGSLLNQTAGRYISLWRATGQPGQGDIPTTAALCDNTLTGAIQFVQQTPPNTSYLAYAFGLCANSTATVEFHDRLAHRGGMVLNSTAPQAVNMNLETLGINADRRGDANYSDIQWWLEVYGDGGATASNATINVTYNDDTTGNLNNQAVGGTIRVGNWFSLNGIDPAAGKFIKGINTVTLSASTGTAGNFGFTATRHRASMPLLLANKAEVFDWAQLGLPEIINGSCLQLAIIGTSTNSGILRGGAKIAHG